MRNPNCDLCLFGAGSQTKPKNICLVPSIDDIKARPVAIIAEQPYHDDDLYGKVFISKQLARIRKFFADEGLDAYCTYALKCPRPSKNVKPTEKQVKVCALGFNLATKKKEQAGFLEQELKLVQPEHVVTLGANAFYATTGSRQGTVRPNGGRYYDEKLGFYLYPTIHPIQAAYSVQHKEALWADLRRFADWIKGGKREQVEFSPPVYVADTLKSLRALQQRIRAAGGVVAVDTETQGLNPYVFGKHIRSIQFCWDADFGGVFVPLMLEPDCYYTDKSSRASFWTDEPLVEAVEIIREILWESKCIWHNGKFDRLWLYMWGLREFGEPILAPNILMDTLHVAHLLDENRVLKLKQLIISELGFPTYDIPNKRTKDLDVLIPYACKDTVSDTLIAKRYVNAFDAPDLERTRKLYVRIIRPMDKLFTKMELRGWPVDRDTCLKVRGLAQAEFEKVDRRLHEILLGNGIVLGFKKARVTKIRRGKEVEVFESVPADESDVRYIQKCGLDACKDRGVGLDSKTFASPQKLAILLFETLGYQPNPDKSIAYTKSGGLATNEDALVHLKGDPLIDALFEWRGHAKALSTYIAPMLEAAETRGRITTSYKLHGTVTGRTASGKENEKRARGKTDKGMMNLQNLPYDTYGPEKLSVRHCIRAREGWSIVEADFSQIELRIAGMLSQDPLLLKAYQEDEDIHAIRAMRVARYTPEQWVKLPKEVQKDLRKKAKPVNFGYIYGMQARGFQRYALTEYGIHFNYDECVEMREQFFRDHTGLERWYARQERECQRKGYVENATGRRRHLPDIRLDPDSSRDAKSKYSSAVRMAINTPVQSFASDLKLMSLIAVDKAIDEDYAYLFGEVHDSILLEVRNDMLDDMVAKVLSIMSHPPLLDKLGIEVTVPIKADVKVGPSLGEIKDYVPMKVAA